MVIVIDRKEPVTSHVFLGTERFYKMAALRKDSNICQQASMLATGLCSFPWYEMLWSYSTTAATAIPCPVHYACATVAHKGGK